MKQFTIAVLLAVAALVAFSAAWADDITSLATGLNSIQVE